MNRKIHLGGVFGTSILLVLIGLGFRPGPLAKAAGNGSGDIPEATKQHLVENYGKLPLSFEANVGQTSRQVKFLSRGQGYTLFLTRRAEAVLVLGKTAPKSTSAQPADTLSAFVKPELEASPPAVLRMKLMGAKPTPQVEGLDEFPGKANYFVGNDPKKWRTNVRTYAKVRYREVYPGVDLVYYGKQRQLEHDFVIVPGADPGSITMAVEGAERLSVDVQGDLVLALKGGEVRFQKPVVYQEVEGVRREIPSSYMLKGARQVGFQVAAYDASQPLIIDPVLSYSTYLGGSGGNVGYGIAVDATGNTYVTGFTTGSFPTTAGAYQTTFGGGTDAFVTVLNALGSALLYSTYLGGSGFDVGNGIAVDATGNAYVTGYTTGSFPTTAGAYQTTFGGGTDAFVTVLNALGSAPLYSTYLGGSGYDDGYGIAVDTTGNAYVTGSTTGSFPTTVGAYQTTYGGGGTGAFVTKLNALASPLYSTYLGGSGGNAGYGIAVDATGNAYVTGFTTGSFPTTAGAYQTTFGGGTDAFVTVLNALGSAPLYSTYLGGSGYDVGYGLAVDATGNAYVTGYTGGSFPTTAGAYQTTFGGGATDAFVTKLNPLGSLLYSTYLGGGGDNVGYGIAVDATGNAYLTGYTNGSFPTTAGAYQTTYGGGGTDAFVTVLNALGSALLYSTYLGGSGYDVGKGIAVGATGNAYVTGYTTGSFPTTARAYQTTYGGGYYDPFVTKIAGLPTCKPEKDDMTLKVTATRKVTTGVRPSSTFARVPARWILTNVTATETSSANQ
ncbi:MAG: hypothetical protein DMG69_15010 [Acidobacteria bacterium]|nr:MAG: hypothetical protein DMG69_15010 [Acidobacteriota bacterium]